MYIRCGVYCSMCTPRVYCEETSYTRRRTVHPPCVHVRSSYIIYSHKVRYEYQEQHNYTLRRFTSSSSSLSSSTIGSSRDDPPRSLADAADALRFGTFLRGAASMGLVGVHAADPEVLSGVLVFVVVLVVLEVRFGFGFCCCFCFLLSSLSFSSFARRSSSSLSFTRHTSTGTPADRSTSIQIWRQPHRLQVLQVLTFCVSERLSPGPLTSTNRASLAS